MDNNSGDDDAWVVRLVEKVLPYTTAWVREKILRTSLFLAQGDRGDPAFNPKEPPLLPFSEHFSTTTTTTTATPRTTHPGYLSPGQEPQPGEIDLKATTRVPVR